MPRFSLLFLALLLAGCTPRHFYTGPTGGPLATLQEKATAFEDRNGETLRENYKLISIDGKTLRFTWRSAAIDGHYHVSPGPHKVIVRAGIRRGSAWNSDTVYIGVLNATLAEGKHYLVNGPPPLCRQPARPLA